MVILEIENYIRDIYRYKAVKRKVKGKKGRLDI